MEREATLPNYFSEAIMALNPKPDKEKYNKGNYRQISLMNVDIKNPNTILANITQQCRKGIINH